MNASLFWTNADVPLYSSPGVVGIHWKLQEKSLAASNCSARQWRIELIEINCSKGTNNNTDDGLGKF